MKFLSIAIFLFLIPCVNLTFAQEEYQGTQKFLNGVGAEFYEEGTGSDIEYFLEGKLEDNVKIDPSEKTITFEYDSTGIKEDVLIIYLPSEIIDQPLGVYVNGDQEPNAIRNIMENETKMIIPLYEDSKTITIRGANVIPEFGSVTFFILGIAIFTGVAFSSKIKIKKF